MSEERLDEAAEEAEAPWEEEAEMDDDTSASMERIVADSVSSDVAVLKWCRYWPAVMPPTGPAAPSFSLLLLLLLLLLPDSTAWSSSSSSSSLVSLCMSRE